MPEIVSLFLIIGLGAVLKRKGFLSVEIEKWISECVLYIAIPATLVTSLYSMEIVPSGKFWLRVLGITGFAYLFMLLFGVVIAYFMRCEDAVKRSFRFLTVFNNVGNLAFPVIGAVYGSMGILYAAAFNIVFNVLLWTLGVWMLREKGEKFSIKRIFSPALMAIIVGYGAYLLRIPLPAFLELTISKLANILAPLAMILIGSLLASLRPREIFADRRLWCFVLLKHLLMPTLFFPVALFLFQDNEAAAICTLMVAMPCAVSNAAFMEAKQADAGLAARAVVLTTPVALASFPLLISLTGLN